MSSACTYASYQSVSTPSPKRQVGNAARAVPRVVVEHVEQARWIDASAARSRAATWPASRARTDAASSSALRLPGTPADDVFGETDHVAGDVARRGSRRNGSAASQADRVERLDQRRERFVLAEAPSGHVGTFED